MPTTALETTIQRLARELSDGQSDELALDLERWMVASRRFRTFVEAHRQKIRKKLRTAADADSRRDVWAELRAAQLLLADRRIGLAFEAYAATIGGPDFTVCLGGSKPFNLEVTRVRGGTGETWIGGPILAKLRQLPPGISNALLVAVDGDDAGAFDVAGDIRGLRARADAKDEAFFTARGFAGSRGFYERFLRLGAVIVWCDGARDVERAAGWRNPSARIPFPEAAVRACLAAIRAG